jgi:hypothetical protein
LLQIESLFRRLLQIHTMRTIPRGSLANVSVTILVSKIPHGTCEREPSPLLRGLVTSGSDSTRTAATFHRLRLVGNIDHLMEGDVLAKAIITFEAASRDGGGLHQ